MGSPNWTAYNAAQSEEKARFVELLADLCRTVEQPEQDMGRPRLPLSDMLFAAAYKVYVGFSARRFTSDLKDAQMRGLIGNAAHFQLRDVSADKAYLSRKNLRAVEELGGTPFVPFKKNTLEPTVDEDSTWAKMYYYFMYNRLNFMEHYHMRSNVESAFSMIKGKFGDAVRSKSDTGQVNEALCKVLCHNICCLVQAIHELERR
jgi:transposase